MSTPSRSPGQITTFYSYKGGTGRTMLLANVAWILASAGNRVLAIDWDLEAPGLHQYFHPFLIDPHLEATDGLIDMLVEYGQEAVTPEELGGDGDWLDRAADVRRFVASVNWSFPDGGQLHILPAGRQTSSFSVRVNTFQWPDFYERLKGGAFLELVKKKIRNEYEYDHILIDSRTGVSDTSGICTVQMPDRLVVCFTASEQSIQGSATVAASAWAHWTRLTASSSDGKLELDSPRRIFPILMRIEGSEKEKLDATRAHVREVFGSLRGLPENDEGYWNRAEVGYWPFYAFEEILAVFGDRFRTESSLLAACEHVTALITDGAVNRLAPPEPSERERILAAYQRRVGRGSADAGTVMKQPTRPADEAGRGTKEDSRAKKGQRWFLSYNSRDQALAERLKTAIERKDGTSRVFFAPAQFRAGGFWLKQVTDEISDATAFVLLLGEYGVGDWQVLEYGEALDRRVRSPDFPVVLVLLEGQTAPGLPFLRHLEWIVTADPASERSISQLMRAAAGVSTTGSDRWRHTAPYRGLSPMTEIDSEFFFGRGDETAEVIEALATAPDRLPVLIGSSGVGKSSLAQAGVLAALMEQAWPATSTIVKPWPEAFCDSRRWYFLKLRPGAEPVRALVEAFLRTWQFGVVDRERQFLLADWTERFRTGAAVLRDLLDATEHRLQHQDQPTPPAFFIYVDQGEELYVRAGEYQRRCFSELLAGGLQDPRLRAMMSMRADFFGELQRDPPLYAVHRLISVPPLRGNELRDVVIRPAELLGARFESDQLADDIAERVSEESVKDAGALPMLSYLLEDMWAQMVRRGDGVLRLPAHALELGAVLADRANAFLSGHPDSLPALQRIFTLRLATVRENSEPTRRRAHRSEFSDNEWRLVSELADHPNRLLVVTAPPEGHEAYAEVAHEAIFRRWDRLRDWIANEREFLAWRSGLEAALRAWEAAPVTEKSSALLMGLALVQAQSWLMRRAEDLPEAERNYIVQSIRAAQRRKRRLQFLVGTLAVYIFAGLIGWFNQNYLRESWRNFTNVRPYTLSQIRPHVLSKETESSLKPLQSFRECARDCPEMTVMPAGEFIMGSPPGDTGSGDSLPQHKVLIAKPFAVSKFAVTFDEWDACAAHGDCDPGVSDSGWGRGRQPAINVSWDDARRYVAWLSRSTGKPYRLLTEAEWEYAARAGTATAYFWGNDVGTGNANCNGCGSIWDNKQAAPVGSFAPNAFGLYDMAGNVWQWVEDCYHENYQGAPTDGSAWTGRDCSRRVVRGGSWSDNPAFVRSASRSGSSTVGRDSTLGFRIARTLSP